MTIIAWISDILNKKVTDWSQRGSTMQWIIRDIPLGHNIQKLRKRQGLTQEQLVAKMQICGSGISRSTLANIEAGARNVKASDLKLMKKLLKAEYEEFFEN